jgi:hypothetical protein
MATLRERLKARREAERRKLRSFTIGVSEDDLRVIAKQGYGGAVIPILTLSNPWLPSRGVRWT